MTGMRVASSTVKVSAGILEDLRKLRDELTEQEKRTVTYSEVFSRLLAAYRREQEQIKKPFRLSDAEMRD